MFGHSAAIVLRANLVPVLAKTDVGTTWSKRLVEAKFRLCT